MEGHARAGAWNEEHAPEMYGYVPEKVCEPPPLPEELELNASAEAEVAAAMSPCLSERVCACVRAGKAFYAALDICADEDTEERLVHEWCDNVSNLYSLLAEIDPKQKYRSLWDQSDAWSLRSNEECVCCNNRKMHRRQADDELRRSLR